MSLIHPDFISKCDDELNFKTKIRILLCLKGRKINHDNIKKALSSNLSIKIIANKITGKMTDDKLIILKERS